MRLLCWAALGAMLAGGAAACFSERASGPGPSASAVCQVPVTVIDSMNVVVAIQNFTFAPDSIVVAAGGTVTWVNCEDPLHEPHTTTADAGQWNSPEFSAAQRFSVRFTVPGTFTYHCTPHPFMLGKIVVH